MVGAFPDGKSALMFVTARLKYVAVSEWGSKRYLDVTLLDERPHRMAGLWGCRKVRKDLDGASPVTPLSGFAVRLIWRADRFLWFSALLDVRPLQLVAWIRRVKPFSARILASRMLVRRLGLYRVAFTLTTWPASTESSKGMTTMLRLP